MSQVRIKDKSDRRKEILAAARQVLAQKGLESTKISEIVAHAGVAQGTFYLYFPSKVALILALAEEMLDSVLTKVQEAITGLDRFSETIAAGISAAFHQMGSYRDVLVIINNSAALVAQHTDCEKLFQPYYLLMADLIRQGQATGEANPKLNPELTARMVVRLVERGVEDCYLYLPDFSAETYISEITNFVNTAFAVKKDM